MSLVQDNEKIRITVCMVIIAWLTSFAYSQELDPNHIRRELLKIDWEAKADMLELQYASIKSSVDYTLPQRKIVDVVTLWKFKKDYDYFELLWWRIDDPNFRVVIIYLMKKGRDKGSSAIPDFSNHANRFSDREKEMRLQEIKLVDDLLIKIK